MKTLKIKAASAALLLTLFAVNASAQPQRKAPQGGGEKPTAEKIAEISTDKLDQKLELTDSQEKKIYAINLKYAQERDANKPEERPERVERPERGAKDGEAAKAERPDREEMKAKMEAAQANRKAHMVEIMSILTDEQKVDYALMLSEQQGRGQQGRGQKGQQGQQGQRGQGGQRGPKGQGGQGAEDGKRGPQQQDGERGGERQERPGRQDRPERPEAIEE
ncbi:MAG: DUF4890 domain-containing protein [Rikenellaceae bacterium]